MSELVSKKIALVIPAYRVAKLLPDVVASVPALVGRIFVVDDGCPEQSGKVLQSVTNDSRVAVLFHPINQGVGAAVVTGYRAALTWGADIVVRIDGDGQMDTSQMERFVHLLQSGRADFVKGNRFFEIASLSEMPTIRLIGNTVLSFAAKAMSGYWNVMDPTNGYSAIDSRVLRKLPLESLEKRYFFESDLLFHLALLRAVIAEIPVKSVYGDEQSSLSIVHCGVTFPLKYIARFLKRIFYNYFLRDFNVFSLELLLGIVLVVFGTIFGGIHWYRSIVENTPATTGTIMVAALPIILGFQLLVSAVSFDVGNFPKTPISDSY
ncbi:MAG: glycosyltransferase family 2 protein [Bdellovibrionales bacterium]|nr:glycosyltransferase family 2 protein [Bdellovibrionales bacterium]